MDIEAIVKKYAGGLLGVTYRSAENVLRAAMTELAAEYEQDLRIYLARAETSEADYARAVERIRQLSETHALEMRAYEATVANQAERIRQLEAALNGLVSIAHDSNGVAGYHLNGDIADWYSFPEFAEAVFVLAAAPQQEKEGE